MHAGNPHYLHTKEGTSGKFTFPPGHRQEIIKFVTEIKQLQGTGNRLQKRQRSECTKNTKANQPRLLKEDEDDSAVCSQPTRLYQDILVKWQRQKKDEWFQKLKENEDYEIKIHMCGDITVCSIVCKSCSNSYKLTLADKVFKISNWTRHVKSCPVATRKCSKTEKIHQYFQPNPVVSEQSATAEKFVLAEHCADQHFWIAPPNREGQNMTANNGAVMSLEQPETPLVQTIGALTQLEPEPNSSLFSHSLSS